jgi:hypothetical protein
MIGIAGRRRDGLAAADGLYDRALMRIRRRQQSPSMACESFGVRFGVAVDAPELQARVEEILPPGWIPCDPAEAAARFSLRQADPDGYDVLVDENPSLQKAPLDMALGMLDSQIRMFIAERARDWIFVHAGTVARAGRALLLPGKSFSGKTTLVKALVEVGGTYYSDEYAVLDAEGNVHPYPRRLSIRHDGGTDERSVSQLGGVAGDERASVATVILTRYRPGAAWEPKTISRAQGALALLENTVPAQDHPRESLRAVTRAVAGATVLESDRGEAESIAAALLGELTRRSG